MCELISTKTKDPSGKGFHVDIVCSKTGKRPTVVNQYGMFCEDLCDMDGCIEGFNMTHAFIKDFMKMTGLED